MQLVNVMGKRGPKAQKKELLKSAAISFRLSPEIRRQLEELANETGNTLSQEITQILEQSFGTDKHGPGHPSPQTFAFVGLLAEAIWEVEKCTGERWQKNPFTHDMARRTINQVLSYYKPRGAKRAPSDFPSPRGAKRSIGNVSIVGERSGWSLQDLKQARGAFLRKPDHLPTLIAEHIASLVHTSTANPSVPFPKPYREAARHLAKRLNFDETPPKPRRRK